MARKIGDVDEAWETIEEAAFDGNFVPVLGFDIAASTIYADASAESQRALRSTKQLSVQHLELAMIAARLAHLRHYLEASAARQADGCEEAGLDCDDAIAVPYVKHVQQLFNEFGIGDELDIVIPESDPLFRFQLAVVRLSAALTAEWASRLTDRPMPLGSAYTNHAAPISEQSDNWQTIGLIREMLDACVALEDLDLNASALNEDQVYWMYVKLLRLASQVVGKSADLWAKGDFTARHARMIASLRQDDVNVEWRLRDGQPESEAKGAAGVQFAHLVWLEELLKFTLSADARTYRTRAELAFALSLDDPGIGIPRMPADPFEIGLLYSESGSHDLGTLRKILDFSSYDSEGNPRVPGGFHRAVAKIMRHSMDKLTASASLQDTQVAQKQIIITLGMDLEMERALEECFDSYRVLVPVYMTIRGHAAASDEDDPDAEDSPRFTPVWLLGTFRHTDVGFQPTWTDTSSEEVELAGEGPLLIKMFGSPAHDLPHASEFSANPNIDREASPNPSHRLVLDEMELLNVLSRLTPEEKHMAGLRHRLRSSRLFFFGQDTMSWGDRVPYLMVDAIKANPGGSGGESAPKPAAGVWGKGSTKARRSRSGHSAVAVAKSDLFGKGVWKRLNMAEIDYEDAPPRSIVKRIVEEVAKW